MDRLLGRFIIRLRTPRFGSRVLAGELWLRPAKKNQTSFNNPRFCVLSKTCAKFRHVRVAFRTGPPTVEGTPTTAQTKRRPSEPAPV